MAKEIVLTKGLLVSDIKGRRVSGKPGDRVVVSDDEATHFIYQGRAILSSDKELVKKYLTSMGKGGAPKDVAEAKSLLKAKLPGYRKAILVAEQAGKRIEDKRTELEECGDRLKIIRKQQSEATGEELDRLCLREVAEQSVYNALIDHVEAKKAEFESVQRAGANTVHKFNSAKADVFLAESERILRGVEKDLTAAFVAYSEYCQIVHGNPPQTTGFFHHAARTLDFESADPKLLNETLFKGVFNGTPSD